jgi:hypothetical protein
MTTSAHHRSVHLVGSVPLADAEEVFRTASTILGDHVTRLPDGETGVRTNWIGWQLAVFARNPALELVPDADREYARPVQYRLRPGAIAAEVTFDNLGYADAALASYRIFAQLKADGVILSGTRFQVCLPTPLAPVAGFIDRASQAAVEPAYEARMHAELDAICAGIPHNQLAIQWDTAIEFALWEGVVWQTYLADVQTEILERLVRIGGWVPADVELGYHLCYGDAGHQHFVQPRDAANLVTVANAIADGVKRPIQWIHLPVPRERTDAAYFAPLTHLSLHPETELYLGLIHLTDGVAGALTRIAAAEQAVQAFGVATECGFGRRPAETVMPLLTLHRSVVSDAEA